MTFLNHLCFGKFGKVGSLTSFLGERGPDGLDPVLSNSYILKANLN